MAEYRRFYDNIRAQIVNAINQQDTAVLKDEIAFCMNWGEPLSSMGAVAQAALQLMDEQSAAPPRQPGERRQSLCRLHQRRQLPSSGAGGWVAR